LNGINSGRLSFEIALARGGAGVASVTPVITKYPLNPMNANSSVTIWDLPGFKSDTYQSDEFTRILRGHWKNGYNPCSAEQLQQALFNREPTFQDRVHGLILLVKADMADADADMNINARFIRAAESLDIPYIIGVSQVDSLDATRSILKSPALALSSLQVKNSLTTISRKLQVQQKLCIPFVNAVGSETEDTLSRDILVYLLLQSLLENVMTMLFKPHIRESLEQYRELQKNKNFVPTKPWIY